MHASSHQQINIQQQNDSLQMHNTVVARFKFNSRSVYRSRSVIVMDSYRSKDNLQNVLALYHSQLFPDSLMKALNTNKSPPDAKFTRQPEHSCCKMFVLLLLGILLTAVYVAATYFIVKFGEFKDTFFRIDHWHTVTWNCLRNEVKHNRRLVRPNNKHIRKPVHQCWSYWSFLLKL